MLVLTRKPGERIVVGNNYQVEIVAVENGVVKFAFYVDQPIILMPGNVELDVGDSSPVRLTRKVDDSVVIGSDPQREIEVLVVSVKGEAVRVGVKAPRDVQVHRQEVFELIERENIEAAKTSELDSSELRRLMDKRAADDDSGPAD